LRSRQFDRSEPASSQSAYPLFSLQGPEKAVIRWRRAGKERHPVRTWLIRCGVALIVIGSIALLAGLAGLFPLEMEKPAWNNIRIVAGSAILGCLMAAVGYGNE
jgi:hypothetical protein